MKPHSKDLKDLALLISVIGLGLSSGAAAQTVAEAPTATSNDEPQRSDWDWVPPDAVAASQAEQSRLMALPAEPAPAPAFAPALKLIASVEAAIPPPSPPAPPLLDPELLPSLAKSDWDWSPGDLPGALAVHLASASPQDREPRPVAATKQADRSPERLPQETPVVARQARVAVVAAAPEPAAAVGSLPSIDAPAPARFIVANHSDKVLMSLLSVQAGPDSDWGRLLPTPAEVAVAPHPAEQDEWRVLQAADAAAVPAFSPLDAARSVAVLAESPIHVLAEPKPLEAPPRVVVATHTDKVLLSLTSVRAADTTPMELMALLPQDIAVSKVAPANAPQAPSAIAGKGWVAVDTHQLDRVRGGFATPQLQVSFGISRAVYVNGNLVTTTSLNLAGLGKPGAGLPATANLPASLGLVQSGSGNAFLSTPTGNAMANGSVATVIQNTLNNQKIQSVTQINATVNSMQILKGMNLQQTLRSSVIDSLRH